VGSPQMGPRGVGPCGRLGWPLTLTGPPMESDRGGSDIDPRLARERWDLGGNNPGKARGCFDTEMTFE